MAITIKSEGTKMKLQWKRRVLSLINHVIIYHNMIHVWEVDKTLLICNTCKWFISWICSEWDNFEESCTWLLFFVCNKKKLYWLGRKEQKQKQQEDRVPSSRKSTMTSKQENHKTKNPKENSYTLQTAFQSLEIKKDRTPLKWFEIVDAQTAVQWHTLSHNKLTSSNLS